MTTSQLLAVVRRSALPSLMVGFAVLFVVFASLASRGEVYETRIALKASPAVTVAPRSAGFGEVVSLSMPALAEILSSRDVLDHVREIVPDSPSVDELARDVDIQIVPSSGVARITVHASTPALSESIVLEIVGEVERADLLTPVGTFERVGGMDPQPSLVRPDLRAAAGFGIAAALLAAVLAAIGMHAWSPSLLTRRDVENVVHHFATERCVVVDVAHSRRWLGLPVAAAGSRRPPLDGIAGRIVAIGRPFHLEDGSRQLENHTPLPVILTVRLREATRDDLVGALWAARESGSDVSLVLVG